MPFAHILNKNNGLQSNSIYDIFQDQKGFIWLATGKGLCKYNGNQFFFYKSTHQTMKSGSCIKQDQYGRIWYANFDGFLYYIENEVLKEFPQKTNSGFMNFGITKDYIYLPLEKSILLYDIKTFKLIKEIAVGSKIINALQIGEDFYVLTFQLTKFSNGKKTFSIPFPINTDNDFIAPLMVNHQNKIHIVSKFSKKYYIFDQIFKEIPLNITNDFIQNLSSTNHNIWLNTASGTFRFNEKNSEFNHFFKDNNITCVFEDAAKHFWIGTQNSGVFHIPNFSTTLDISIKNPSKIIMNNVATTIGTLKDEVYFNNQIIHQSKENHAVNFLWHDTINQKLIWASSKLYYYDLKKQKIEKKLVFALKDLIQIDHKYYAYSSSGTIGLIKNENNFKSYWDGVSIQSKNVTDNRIVFKNGLNGKAVTKSQNGKYLYFGTNQGLFLFNLKGEKELMNNGKRVFISQLKNYENEVFALASNDILYKIKEDKIIPFEIINNLTNNNTQRIFVSQHFLFVYNGKELYEYNLKTKKIIKRFHSNEYEIFDVVKTKYQQIIILTNNGKITLKSDDFNDNFKPFLKLNPLVVDGQKIVSIKKEIILNADTKSISIPFEYINFRPNENHEIQYKINQENWYSFVASTNSLQFNSLAPGNYTILLKVKNYDQTIQSISFTIQKPWYLRIPFLVFFSIIFIFIIIQLLKFQRQRINKKNKTIFEKIELEKNLNQSTLKAIKSQMNPHFFFNALNTIQSFILLNDKKQAINYLSKFSLLTRNILDMTEKEYISIQDEIKTLTTYLELEEVRFNEDFSFEIKVDDKIDVENQKIPTMIIQPYVENAIKHGLLHKQGLKKLVLSFMLDEEKIKVIIDDNGVGRQKSSELNALKNKNHKSFATKAIQNRIDLINNNIENKITILFEDKNNDMSVSQGTVVIINFPNNIL